MADRLGTDMEVIKEWIDSHPDYLLILSADHGHDERCLFLLPVILLFRFISSPSLVHPLFFFSLLLIPPFLFAQTRHPLETGRQKYTGE